MRTAEQSALVLAAIFERSKQNRARVSARTVRLISGRVYLRGAFMILLFDALAQYGVGMVELNTGGFGLVRNKTLEAAPPITVKKLMTDKEKEALRNGHSLDFGTFEDEIIAVPSEHDGED